MPTLLKPVPAFSGEVKERLLKASRGSFTIIYQALKEARAASTSSDLNSDDVILLIKKRLPKVKP